MAYFPAESFDRLDRYLHTKECKYWQERTECEEGPWTGVPEAVDFSDPPQRKQVYDELSETLSPTRVIVEMVLSYLDPALLISFFYFYKYKRFTLNKFFSRNARDLYPIQARDYDKIFYRYYGFHVCKLYSGRCIKVTSVPGKIHFLDEEESETLLYNRYNARPRNSLNKDFNINLITVRNFFDYNHVIRVAKKIIREKKGVSISADDFEIIDDDLRDQFDRYIIDEEMLIRLIDAPVNNLTQVFIHYNEEEEKIEVRFFKGFRRIRQHSYMTHDEYMDTDEDGYGTNYEKLREALRKYSTIRVQKQTGCFKF